MRPEPLDQRFQFALTKSEKTGLLEIQALTNEKLAAIVRRMIVRDTPFFLAYASQFRSLPPSVQAEDGKEQGQ